MDRFTANRLLYGSVLALCLMGGVALGGLVAPFIGIKLIDILVDLLHLA